jgi:transcriptional regulator with XRE-family HTH domain
MTEALPEDPNVSRLKLGIELHRHREAAKLTQRGAADALEWSLSKLGRIEKGAHGVSVSDLRALLQLYQVDDPAEIDGLAAAARASRGKSWWDDYSDIVTPQLARLLGYEGMAKELLVSHPLLVPGLLHTEDYASALFAVYPRAVNARRLVELRMRRQRQVFAQPGTSLSFVLGEEALYRWIGGPTIMRHQLEHLIAVGQRDRVSIRLIPLTAGAHPGLTTPFVMVRRLDNGSRLVFVEGVNGDQLIQDDPAQLGAYVEYGAALQELSVGGDQAEDLMRAQLERLRRAERSSGDSGQ